MKVIAYQSAPQGDKPPGIQHATGWQPVGDYQGTPTFDFRLGPSNSEAVYEQPLSMFMFWPDPPTPPLYTPPAPRSIHAVPANTPTTPPAIHTP